MYPFVRHFRLLTVALAATASANAAVLYSVENTRAGGATSGNFNYDAPLVTVTTALNTTGSNSTQLGGTLPVLVAPSGGLGSRVRNNDQTGYLTFQSGADTFAVSSQATLNGEYLLFTVTADPGYQLNLESLGFNARRATTGANARGISVWGATNGSSFTYTPAGYLLQTNVTANRSSVTPDPFMVDLTGASYQGIDSITFRMFATGGTTNHGMDLSGLTLNGTVSPVPEPSAALLATAAATLGLLRRRRA